MIPQEELRIGNYVIDAKTGKCVTVDGIQISGRCVVQDVAYDDGKRGIEPEGIKLTPDILISCGFTKFGYPDHSERKIRDMYFIQAGHVQITFAMGEVILAGSSNSDTDALVILSKFSRNIHNLQNLYFALTGKELEVKL